MVLVPSVDSRTQQSLTFT